MQEFDPYVLSTVIEVTKDEKSRPYWQYAIRELGEAAVEEELGEVKMRFLEGRVDNPAKYLTSLLQKRLKEKQACKASENKKPLQTYFSSSALSFVKELQPQMSHEGYSIIDSDRKMSQPYSSKQIPWATFVGPDFFTLSTNKTKSDEVIATFRTTDGDLQIPLLRGRKFPGDSERGILTAEHGKVLGALENFWAQQDCKYMAGKGRDGSEICLCYCVISASKLIRFLGKSSDGAANTKHIKTILTDLESFPYYLKLEDIPEFKQMGIKGYGFTLLASSTLLEVNHNPHEGTILKIIFSETYSRQLLARRVTTRSLDLIRTRSELAFLVHLYIEPFLIKHKYFQKSLLSLIQDLQLPHANWHGRAGARKQQFEKAIKELSNKRTGTGQTMSVRVRPKKGVAGDYILEAQLTGDKAPELEKEAALE